MKLNSYSPVLFLRSSIYLLGSIISLMVFSTLGLFLFMFSFKVRYSFISQWAVFSIWWLKITCNLSYKVHGAEHINKERVGLILSKHGSTWESLAMQLIFPRQVFVLKKELFMIPFFGWSMAMLNPIGINRSSVRQALRQLLSKGKQRLADGNWVVIYPEGTRIPYGKTGKIKVGGSMLAIESKVDTYLVNHNAGKFWQKNTFIKKPGVIEVFIKEPINPENMSVQELNLAIETWFKHTS